MSAVVDHKDRLILVSGALGSNRDTVRVLVDNVPPGKWRVIKSETNLTDDDWTAWQITFGEGTRVADGGKLISGQFRHAQVFDSGRRLVFRGGSVIQGGAILKIYDVDHRVQAPMVFSHNRATKPMPNTTELHASLAHDFKMLPERVINLETTHRR